MVVKGNTHDDEDGDNPMAAAHWGEGHYSDDVYQDVLTRTPQYSCTEYSVR